MTLQSAAIPYRRSGNGHIEVLLVTSRRQGRWVFPKGNVKSGIPPHISAALEAYEEAGVIGLVYAKPLGTYTQTKISPDGNSAPIRVQAYTMMVTDETGEWPEMNQRHRSWMTVDTATEAVRDPELRKVIRRLQTFASSTVAPDMSS